MKKVGLGQRQALITANMSRPDILKAIAEGLTKVQKERLRSHYTTVKQLKEKAEKNASLRGCG